MDFQGHQIFPPFHVKEHVQMANPGAFKCSLSTEFEDVISCHRNENESTSTTEGTLKKRALACYRLTANDMISLFSVTL
jgi:hypothetical protein